MKNIKTASLIISLSFFLTSCNGLGSFFKDNSDKSPVISKYKNGKVTLQEAQEELDKFIAKNDKLKGLTFDKLEKDQKETIIKEVIIKKIIYKQAKKQKLDKEEDYKKSIRLIETELLKQKLFVKLIEDAKKEENVKKYYDELVEKLKNKQDIRVKYISVATEKQANSISRILTRSPNSFESQAKAKSLDKETAKKGGDLGFVLEDILPAEVVSKVKLMKRSEISQPIPLGDKWVLVKLEDIRPAKIEKFENVKEDLADNLAQKTLKDFISDSIENAKISFITQ